MIGSSNRGSRGADHRQTERARAAGSWLTVVAGFVIAMLWMATKDAEDSRTDSRAASGEVRGFRVLTEGELVEWGGNDGDSFRVRHEEGTHVFRLYFVDTCEKNDSFPRRLDYQGEYFGGLSRPRVMQLGEDARRASLSWLRHDLFEVYTRHESVMSSDRLFAMIRFPELGGTEDEWLSQRLVRSGLARIYTQGTEPPDGRTQKAFTEGLRTLEAAAQEERVGAWRR